LLFHMMRLSTAITPVPLSYIPLAFTSLVLTFLAAFTTYLCSLLSIQID